METEADAKLDLIQTIAAHPEFSTFSQLLKASGIEDIFTQGGDFTVFAPNNEAFHRLDSRRLLGLLYDADRTKVRNLVLFHVCMGRMVVNEPEPYIEDGRLNGLTHKAGAEPRKRNIPARNGIIHEIGTVLTPATSPCVHPS